MLSALIAALLRRSSSWSISSGENEMLPPLMSILHNLKCFAGGQPDFCILHRCGFSQSDLRMSSQIEIQLFLSRKYSLGILRITEDELAILVLCDTEDSRLSGLELLGFILAILF